MKRVEALHVILGVAPQGTPALDTDAQFGKLTVVQQPTEGIPVMQIGGVHIPLLRCHTDGTGLEDLVRLAQQLSTEKKERLELVRFTFRRHVLWINP